MMDYYFLHNGIFIFSNHDATNKILGFSSILLVTLVLQYKCIKFNDNIKFVLPSKTGSKLTQVLRSTDTIKKP